MEIISLEQPVECTNCGGTGIEKTSLFGRDTTKTCSACKGSGKMVRCLVVKEEMVPLNVAQTSYEKRQAEFKALLYNSECRELHENIEREVFKHKNGIIQ